MWKIGYSIKMGILKLLNKNFVCVVMIIGLLLSFLSPLILISLSNEVKKIDIVYDLNTVSIYRADILDFQNDIYYIQFNSKQITELLQKDKLLISHAIALGHRYNVPIMYNNSITLKNIEYVDNNYEVMLRKGLIWQGNWLNYESKECVVGDDNNHMKIGDSIQVFEHDFRIVGFLKGSNAIYIPLKYADVVDSKEILLYGKKGSTMGEKEKKILKQVLKDSLVTEVVDLKADYEATVKYKGGISTYLKFISIVSFLLSFISICNIIIYYIRVSSHTLKIQMLLGASKFCILCEYFFTFFLIFFFSLFLDLIILKTIYFILGRTLYVSISNIIMLLIVCSIISVGVASLNRNR